MDVVGLLRMIGALLLAIVLGIQWRGNMPLGRGVKRGMFVLVLVLCLTYLPVHKEYVGNCGTGPHRVTLHNKEDPDVPLVLTGVKDPASLSQCIGDHVEPSGAEWSADAACAPMQALPQKGDKMYAKIGTKCYSTPLCICEAEDSCEACP